MKRVTVYIKNLKAIKPAVYFYVLAASSDWVSTLIAQKLNPDAGESNPFVRDAHMQFILGKALFVDALFFVFFAYLSRVLYEYGLPYGKTTAKFLAAMPFIAIGAWRIYTAVIPNLLLGFHFYSE